MMKEPGDELHDVKASRYGETRIAVSTLYEVSRMPSTPQVPSQPAPSPVGWYVPSGKRSRPRGERTPQAASSASGTSDEQEKRTGDPMTGASLLLTRRACHLIDCARSGSRDSVYNRRMDQRRLAVVLAVALGGLWGAGCGTSSYAESARTPPTPPEVLSDDSGGRLEDVAVVQQKMPSRRSPLAAAPIIRKRKQSLAMVDGLQALVGGPGDKVAPQPPQGQAPDARQKLVVTGAVEVSTDDVHRVAAAVRTAAQARGAVIVADELSGMKYGANARFQLRLAPEAVEPLIDWLATQGTLESRRLAASDVSRQYFDEELRLRTLRTELERLDKLLAERDKVALEDVLAVERELTRVRGALEQLEGQHRFLADRVERATLDVHVTSRDQVMLGEPSAKLLVVAHGLGASFADAGARHRNRLGAGVGVLLGRRVDLTFDVLPARGGDARSLLLSVGGALYSDFLGRGRRRFGNPYLGARLGGGSVNGHGAFAYAGELGVELVRHPRFLLDLTGRAVGLYYGKSPKSDFMFVGLLGVGVPF